MNTASRYRRFIAAGFAVATAAAALLPVPAKPFPVAYMVQKDSRFMEGCFDPCLCPIFFSDQLVGGLSLDFVGYDHEFGVYQVTDVDWVLPDLGRRYTGSGKYMVSGRNGRSQRLTLDLSQDGGAPIRYDSGVVEVTVPFPAIDVAIARNGFYCHDTAFFVRAAPTTPITLNLRTAPDSLEWDDYADSQGYDVVAGKLGALQGSGGDFKAATGACLGFDLRVATIPLPPELADTVSGDGIWFLVRTNDGIGGATYDSFGPGQAAPRDPGINASPAACP